MFADLITHVNAPVMGQRP